MSDGSGPDDGGSDVAAVGSERGARPSAQKKPVDPRVAKIYLDKLKKAQVALTGLQLLEKVQKMRPTDAGHPDAIQNRKRLKQDVYRFLREEAVQEGPSFARRDRVKHYQGTLAFKPGVYFVDYGEFHKKWRRCNGGATGFLVAVENLTNRLFVLPTRGKDTRQWMESLAKFIEGTRQVYVVYSDRDSVASKKFRQRVYEKYAVRWYFLKKGHKSYLAERYVGFVKTKLSQVLESDPKLAAGKRWVHLVDPLVKEYNSQTVPGTGYRRQAVCKENYSDFLSQLFGGDKDYDLRISGRIVGPFQNSRWNKAVFRFELGDRVRVSRKADWTDPDNRSSFKKASVVGSFGSRVYTVSARQLRTTKDGSRFVPVYKLKEVRAGGFNFYENDLVKAGAVPPAPENSPPTPAESAPV
jgi:hypothetical protein